MSSANPYPRPCKQWSWLPSGTCVGFLWQTPATAGHNVAMRWQLPRPPMTLPPVTLTECARHPAVRPVGGHGGQCPDQSQQRENVRFPYAYEIKPLGGAGPVIDARGILEFAWQTGIVNTSTA